MEEESCIPPHMVQVTLERCLDMGEQGRAEKMALWQIEENSQCTCERIKKKRKITMEDRMINPEETPLAWRDIGNPNMEESFLYPETEDSRRPAPKFCSQTFERRSHRLHEVDPTPSSTPRLEGRKGVLPLLRHEEPPTLQTPEAEREAHLHIVHWRPSSFLFVL